MLGQESGGCKDQKQKERGYAYLLAKARPPLGSRDIWRWREAGGSAWGPGATIDWGQGG